MNIIVTMLPMWQGQTAFCIAGGASLCKEQTKYTIDHKVIAVNDAYKIVPHANILYACDRQWWEWHNGCPKFGGYKLQHDHAVHDDTTGNIPPYPAIDVILSSGLSGFDDNPARIRTGGNSGYQALHIAMHLGAKKIILLGYDMHAKGIKSHWFGEHPNGRQSDSRYADWLKEFPALQAAATLRNQQIINCTPNSDLKCFPMMSIEDALLK